MISVFDGSRNQAALNYLRAWSEVIIETIGETGATRHEITAACERALASGRLRCRSHVEGELKQSLTRLAQRGRISFDRGTRSWTIGDGI